MSQARVTDFFTQRKKTVGKPAKTATLHATIKDGSSTTHKEFVRVIDEAASIHDAGCVAGSPDKDFLTPRTPKRNSSEAQIAEQSTEAFHSSAKTRRQATRVKKATISKKTTQKSVRKKLVLQDEPPRDLCKVDIASLKSRIGRIRHADDTAVPTCSDDVTPAVPITTTPLSTDTSPLNASVARAKDLATKALRRKEEGFVKQGETPPHDSTRQPAYQRYHTLAQSGPPGLSLPYQYKVLAEMFRSMDTVVAMLYNRCETATFTKVKQGVQDMMRRRFEESHMGQIKTVFPEAYTFKQEKNIPTFSSGVPKTSYQLTVEPLTESDQNEARPLLSALHLLKRRSIFHQNLVSIVKQHHQVFLSSLVPPVSVPDDKLNRWHPHFNVDSVPAVQPSLLPQVPVTEKLITAREVLDKARSLLSPKMEKALVTLALNTGDTPADVLGSCPNPTEPPVAQVPASLKGVSQTLLERIRAKEAQKLQAAMTRNPAQEERLLMMSRLGELARILRSVFVAEKKAALIMEVVCNRMVASYRSSLSTGEMEKHIHLLAEVAADWLTIHPIRKDFYLKLNKKVELSVVLEKLSRRLKEEEGV
ncbi:DNA replication factor Cdt1 isoform X1 [Nothobranchius furzeri]|uniref:Chromatin licensing and DNA replication factor 1 n=2 Tax=Nothobranchius furzeri TaxID=105023 RepID=A0A1A7ZHQ7_NOTFU|nr:chromatin licensing and DNA replication factor 1 [Nothobranchius furzeri]